MRVRISPCLSIVNSPNGTELFSSYGMGHILEGEMLRAPWFVETLAYCRAWRDAEELADFLTARTSMQFAEAMVFVDELRAREILSSDENQYVSRATSNTERTWRVAGWEEAFLFHFVNCADPYYDRPIAALTLSGAPANPLLNGFVFTPNSRRRTESAPPPPRRKSYERALRLVRLSCESQSTRSLARALVTAAAPLHPDESLGFDAFSSMTYLAFGKTEGPTRNGQGVRKTSPSAGGLHPTEIYPIVFDVDGIPFGAYHYRDEDHSLELIVDGERAKESRALIIAREIIERPTVVYVLASIFERSMFRYRGSFGYSMLHNDVGHLLETTRILAGAHGRDFGCNLFPAQTDFEELLGLEPLRESCIAIVAIR